jgi:hypothetical protein
MSLLNKVFGRKERQSMQDESSAVISLAKMLTSLAQRADPSWQRAFWRFECEELRYGSNGSYEGKTGVQLFSVLKEAATFNEMNELARKIWQSEPEKTKRFCVLLLSITSNSGYEMEFEHSDISKWKINMLDGNSGLPSKA